MTVADFFIMSTIIAGIIIGGLYFLNKWASKRVGDQQDIIEKTKQMATIYVIDKKKMKAAESNLPKSVIEQMPRMYKFMKIHLVKAKVGPQIMTMMCEKKVFKALPMKKNVKVEIAGIYIMNMVGMKSEKELKEMRQQKSAENGTYKKPWYKFWSKG